jgi:transcriptional regulator with XRE-family HTH domain
MDSFFFQRVTELCAKRGLSFTGLAKEIGLAQKTTSGWKYGAVPRAKTLKKIADYFHVSVSSLTTPAYSERIESTNLLPQDELELLSIYRQLDKELQTIALGRITELKRGIAQNAIVSAPERGAPEFSGELFPVGISVGANVE